MLDFSIARIAVALFIACILTACGGGDGGAGGSPVGTTSGSTGGSTVSSSQPSLWLGNVGELSAVATISQPAPTSTYDASVTNGSPGTQYHLEGSHTSNGIQSIEVTDEATFGSYTIVYKSPRLPWCGDLYGHRDHEGLLRCSLYADD